MSKRDPLIVGAVVEVDHPFVREKYCGLDEDGPFETMSWKPGIRFEPIAPDDAGAFADGIGKQILTIISLHKPGRYPERVFYTRRWQSPDGRQFGKTNRIGGWLCHRRRYRQLQPLRPSHRWPAQRLGDHAGTRAEPAHGLAVVSRQLLRLVSRGIERLFHESIPPRHPVGRSSFE